MTNALLLRRRGMMQAAAKSYIQFVDPVVEQICIQNFSSDGIGVTYADAAAVTSMNVSLFRNNPNIVSFNEFKYFTGMTTVTAGSSAGNPGLFGGLSHCAEISLPDSIISFGLRAFYNSKEGLNIYITKTLGQWFSISRANYCFNSMYNLYVDGNIVDTIDCNELGINPTQNDVGCLGVKNFIFPQGATSIANYCLTQCKKMEYIEVGANITRIGNYAFSYFGGNVHHNIKILATTPPTLGDNAFAATSNYSIYVPYSADHSVVQAYQAAWSGESSRIFELNQDGTIPI